jgi:hypothetical protein
LDATCASPNSFIGLLVSKTDARSIRTCAQYDAINREVVLNYSNGDPQSRPPTIRPLASASPLAKISAIAPAWELVAWRQGEFADRDSAQVDTREARAAQWAEARCLHAPFSMCQVGRREIEALLFL